LFVQATPEQFRHWNDAALAEGKRIEDWAIEVLDEEARLYFENPQRELPLRGSASTKLQVVPPLDKVADEKNPNALPSLGKVKYPGKGN
jgi:hypothetical protein